MAWLMPTFVTAQQSMLSSDEKKETIANIEQLLNAHYVFPEVATAMGEHLQKQWTAGVFETANDWKAFANALTDELQAVSKDKHLRVRLRRKVSDAPVAESPLSELFAEQEHQSEWAGGFAEVKKLEGNIGYFDLRGFAPLELGQPIADAVLQLLSGCDAILIDLRRNGGGSPDMVQYLCSYFFKEKTHLNSLYWREGNETQEFWTVDVKGKKRPDVPICILTSDYTFSGAEEFCYNMQTRKRATLIGETTGGGANPGGMQRVNDQLDMFIPVGRAINPVTQTNWEGVGVVPDLKTTKEAAWDKALEWAQKAAADYRQQRQNQQQRYLQQAETALADTTAQGQESLFAVFQQAVGEGFLNEMWINILGYQYLQQGKPRAAEAIFYTNTRLFPQSANALDSYAEALLANGKKTASFAQYKKAMALAKAANDPSLAMIQANYERAKATKE